MYILFFTDVTVQSDVVFEGEKDDDDDDDDDNQTTRMEAEKASLKYARALQYSEAVEAAESVGICVTDHSPNDLIKMFSGRWLRDKHQQSKKTEEKKEGKTKGKGKGKSGQRSEEFEEARELYEQHQYDRRLKEQEERKKKEYEKKFREESHSARTYGTPIKYTRAEDFEHQLNILYEQQTSTDQYEDIDVETPQSSILSPNQRTYLIQVGTQYEGITSEDMKEKPLAPIVSSHGTEGTTNPVSEFIHKIISTGDTTQDTIDTLEMENETESDIDNASPVVYKTLTVEEMEQKEKEKELKERKEGGKPPLLKEIFHC